MVPQGLDDRLPGRLAVVQLHRAQLAGLHPRAQVGQSGGCVVDGAAQRRRRAVVVDSDQERVNRAHAPFLVLAPAIWRNSTAPLPPMWITHSTEFGNFVEWSCSARSAPFRIRPELRIWYYPVWLVPSVSRVWH